MKTRKQRSPGLRVRAAELGLGLVEVMIAMSIGLVILGGVGYLFVSTKQMNATQTDGVRMQESVRNALDVMGRAVRQAGYKLNLDMGVEMPEDALGGTNGSGTGLSAAPDTLIVRHDPMWVRDVSAAPNPLLGREIDCEGNTVTSNNTLSGVTAATPVNTNLVEYRFHVKNGKLMCSADASGTADGIVVADNVENMQITYGIGSGKESILSYKENPTADEYTRVSAVRVSLLIRGPTPKTATGGQQVRFNGVTSTVNDGYLRRVVTSTFTIRNQTRFD